MAGCFEKADLVDLAVHHAEQQEAARDSPGAGSPSAAPPPCTPASGAAGSGGGGHGSAASGSGASVRRMGNDIYMAEQDGVSFFGKACMTVRGVRAGLLLHAPGHDPRLPAAGAARVQGAARAACRHSARPATCTAAPALLSSPTLQEVFTPEFVAHTQQLIELMDRYPAGPPCPIPEFVQPEPGQPSTASGPIVDAAAAAMAAVAAVAAEDAAAAQPAAEPAAALPAQEQQEQQPQQPAERRCAACGVAEAPGHLLQKCAGCVKERYCSLDCQRGHWAAHKAECRRERQRRQAAAAVAEHG